MRERIEEKKCFAPSGGSVVGAAKEVGFEFTRHPSLFVKSIYNISVEIDEILYPPP